MYAPDRGEERGGTVGCDRGPGREDEWSTMAGRSVKDPGGAAEKVFVEDLEGNLQSGYWTRGVTGGRRFEGHPSLLRVKTSRGGRGPDREPSSNCCLAGASTLD